MVSLENKTLHWNLVENAVSYQILFNGKLFGTTNAGNYPLVENKYGEYQVIAVDKKQVPSFASEPIAYYNEILIYEAEKHANQSNLNYQGFSGNGFVETSKTVNPNLLLPIEIKEDGNYAIDIKYANGNGPTNTENKCAIRTLRLNKNSIGTIIFPQRGTKEWSNWGFSNSVQTFIKKGIYQLELRLEDYNDNMNEQINQAMIDYIRIIKL